MEERVNQLPDIVFGQPLRKHSIVGFGVFHNWVKRSIFWELPYWKDLLIRHNLDVMHCEKNFLDNIKNTVMDDKGCTKDNTNARLDLQLYCNRSELELIPQDDRTAIKPNASYVLSREQRALICQWLKELRFPDGYASNIARCVNMQELRLFGMESHYCHVFMQRLLPIAFCDFLVDEVWGPLTEMSNFFRALTALIIHVNNMEMWEEKIIQTICKLEKVFPPAFFDSMEHLAIHLPYEAKVGGPVQFRWMPFDYQVCSGLSEDQIQIKRQLEFIPWFKTTRTYYWEEDDARVYKVWRLHCRNHFRDELHRARKAWVRDKKLPEFMHKDTFKILLAKWRSPKYIALQERGRQNQSKGDRVTHTIRCLSIGIHEDRLAAKRGGVRPTPLESYLLTHTTRRPDAPEDAPPTWICPQVEQTYLIIIFHLISHYHLKLLTNENFIFETKRCSPKICGEAWAKQGFMARMGSTYLEGGGWTS
ncbi:hypothetical protein SLEP1_g42766 [Rubroshorea leprosula]|uniref:DUF4218 domain-containing protein n=1 Tax=Rubroshorea leprosula TaxID=152421 RepID=A0AAV5LBW7_9ROSI|nr:hypothetical protein SLEP1_g42766 [Rubroshorea leprosula]